MRGSVADYFRGNPIKRVKTYPMIGYKWRELGAIIFSKLGIELYHLKNFRATTADDPDGDLARQVIEKAEQSGGRAFTMQILADSLKDAECYNVLEYPRQKPL